MLTKAEISRLRSLHEKKHREAAELFVIEGDKTVPELLAAKYPFVELYLTDHASHFRSLPFAHLITPAEMARISHFPTPSAHFAIGRVQRLPLKAGEIDHGLTLALDGVQDAGNIGTLIRIADWFGFARVLLSPDCANLFSQKVINASMGSFARVRVHTVELAVAIAPARVPILGCDLVGNDVHELEPMRDAIIVIGSEGRGLSADVRARIQKFVTIPKYGHAESLNAAVAAAIVCDQIRRSGSKT